MALRTKVVRTSVLLAEDAYAKVVEIAEKNDVSAAWVIRHALTEFLENRASERSLPLRSQTKTRLARKAHA